MERNEGQQQDALVDPYDINDYRSARTRHLLSLAQQYKRFDITDIYIILGVFLVGFAFAMVLSHWHKVKKEKLQELNK